ncbi:DUF2325 domain-containing protein [Acidovorax sp.]|uniref:DUF2325 domain-containing protein n=1 Tax=Acidovorax sp. TaxID=1872122 RepID=UPI0025C4B0F6|nr:DUF2325 domain-containing protein [Acidovorax sp.]MBL7090737.1 DUF2325 domain-containing protein [Acidovorax sp.]
MSSFPQEFLVLCRRLGEAQRRCSAALTAQAAEIQALQAELVQLRGALVVRDTRLAMAHDELAQIRAAVPGLSRRQAMARHIAALAERMAALSRECLRWRLAAQSDTKAVGDTGQVGATTTAPMDVPAQPRKVRVPVVVEAHPDVHAGAAFDASLAAADLVICQTGCISHDAYWRVQDQCRRTGKPCILVDQPLAASGPSLYASLAPVSDKTADGASAICLGSYLICSVLPPRRAPYACWGQPLRPASALPSADALAR